MPRLPTESDFPPGVQIAIVPPPPGDEARNVLLLLHGLGDSHLSFARLGQQMKLPETACLAIRGPHPLLDLGGFHWGDDIVFDSTSAGLDPDAGFARSNDLLRSLVRDTLLATCGYQPRDIVFLGFGQGGMAALSTPVHFQQRGDTSSATEFGGVVSIGAGLPADAPASLNPKCRTPVLLCAGSDGSSVTSTTAEKLGHVFDSVQIKRYRRSGDGMPSNRDEMLPIMQFFSRRLRSSKGVPEGSVEIG